MIHLLAGFRVTIAVPEGATTLGVHPDGTPFVEDTMDPSDRAAAMSLAEVVARWHTGVQELDAALAPLLGDATGEDLRHYRQASGAPRERQRFGHHPVGSGRLKGFRDVAMGGLEGIGVNAAPGAVGPGDAVAAGSRR